MLKNLLSILVIVALLSGVSQAVTNNTTPWFLVDITNAAETTLYFVSYTTNSSQVDSIIDTSDIDPNTTYQALAYLPLGSTTWYLNMTYMLDADHYQDYSFNYTSIKNTTSNITKVGFQSNLKKYKLNTTGIYEISFAYYTYNMNFDINDAKCIYIKGDGVNANFNLDLTNYVC